MKKLFAVAGMGVALCSVTAFADPDPTRVPISRAVEAVSDNIVKNPDNPGLPNALDHLLDNQARQASKGNRGQGVDRADRIDRPDRPNLERPERIVRGNGRADPPGRGKR